MFVQVIQGRASNPEQAKRQLDRWLEELAPAAPGWLGSTSGVTDDGELIGVVRFASAEDAQRNSDRPEQGAWWEGMAQLFTEPPTFHNCTDVDTFLAGGSDDAGFVQVIQARIVDTDAYEAAAQAMRQVDAGAFDRPDLIGGLIARDGDRLTQVVYFTDEASARESEANPPDPEDSPELSEGMARWEAALADVRYLDLRDPWLASA